jgi:uncharacterized SAM-binding protein YcdF (DUF218 family)
MNYILYKTLSLFIMPLGLTVIGLIVGIILFLMGKRKSGAIITILMTAWLWVWSTPVWADFIMGSLEHRFSYRSAAEYPVADDIVILAGGTRGTAGKNLPPLDLGGASDRELFGAELYHAGKAKTIIVSGGAEPISGTGLAGLSMKRFLEIMGVPANAIRIGGESKNTIENAEEVERMMAVTGERTILLVTSAAHMQRAMWLFKRTKLKVIPAPTDFEVLHPPFTLSRLLPAADALQASTTALREYMGLWVYKIAI